MKRVVVCIAVLLPPTLPARAAEAPALVPFCDVLEATAARHDLPVAYFTRLIWQESRFKSDALSPAGAQGVAQFMPATASGRGLADPFATAAALDESAAYLNELRQTFGNLGLAAAAYNAGPGRLSRWLADKDTTDLPQETLDYVAIVTGRPISDWTRRPPPDLAIDTTLSCRRLAGSTVTARDVRPASLTAGTTADKPKDWAVILVANPERTKVLAEYAIVKATHSKVLGGVRPSVVHRRIGGGPQARYIVQVERDTRAAADDFCRRLMRVGGACFVLANR